MHTEAKEQVKPPAPHPETNSGQNTRNPDKQMQPYPPPHHTEVNGRSEPKIPPKAGMGQGPVTPNHAQQQPQTSQALYQYGLISLFDGCASAGCCECLFVV